MAATFSPPKLFGWCHKVQSDVLLSIDRQARDGRMRSLFATEADLLALAFLKHVSSHLQYIVELRSLTSSFATTAEKAETARRIASGGTLSGALLEIDLDAKVTTIGRLACDLLQIGLRLLERSVASDLTADAVLQREPHAAGYFLYTLGEHWWKLSPAMKFLLIGGEDIIRMASGGKPPRKLLSHAIFELGVRGALPVSKGFRSREKGGLPFTPVPGPGWGGPVPTAEEFHERIRISPRNPITLDDLAERRKIKITKDQIKTAREATKVIPEHPLLAGDTSPFRDQDTTRPHAPQAHGLTAVPSLKGRIKTRKKGRKKT